MKQVNFSHSGGFPLEQETLERLQTAYRSELYEALKRHLSIEPNQNYIIAPASNNTKGWAVIAQEEGILYPIEKGTPTNYLKTTRTGTNLIYGTGTSQIAYFDYEAEYTDGLGTPQSSDELTVNYYDLRTFQIVKDLKTIEAILQAIEANIDAVEANISAIETNIDAIEADIEVINQSYLPLNGSKAMLGNLNLGTHRLSKLDTEENFVANVRAIDFKFGSETRRGLLHPGDFLGRAFADSSTVSETSLTVNYDEDWTSTYIGGKVYLNNIATRNINDGSLLVLDGNNQVTKNATLLATLIDRITTLESKQSTAVPIGMVAIWGKPAPFPEGWEEYLPLKGKMPVGLQTFTSEEKSDALDGDGGNGISYYKDIYGSAIFPFETLASAGGRIGKKILTEELPPHYHHKPNSNFKSFAAGSGDYGNSSSTGTGADGGDNSQLAIGNLGANYNTNGDALEQTVGEGKSVVMLNPYRVVNFIEYTGRPSDKTAPTAPTLTASSIGTTSVSLNWSGSTDEFGVTEYVVYGNAISPIPVGNVFNRTIYGLTPGTAYTFYVVAKDEAGNTSPSSNVVAVTTTTADLIPPTTPTGLTCYAPEDGYLTVEWNSSTDNVGVTRYQVWRRTLGGTSELYLGTPDNYCTVYGTANTTYYFKVKAFDAAGNESPFSSEVSGTVTSGSGSGGGGCFDIESLVTMASGQSKKLKNIEIGDKLQGFSFPNEIDESDGDYMVWNGKLNEAVKTEVTVVNKKASLQPNYFEIKTADNTIKATGQHPLLVTEDSENVKWVCVKNVSQNMLLIDKTGKTKVIESIVFKEEPLEVLLLDVEDVDNYVISGIVAHNNKPEIEPTNP